MTEKSGALKNIIFFYCVQTMDKEIITVGDIEVVKHKFYHRRNLILLEDVDIKKNCRCLVWCLQMKKNINISLVTKIVIIMTISYNASKDECLCKTL